MPSTVRVGGTPGHVPSLTLALTDPEAREIVLDPGTYVEHVRVAPRPHPLLIRSATGRAQDVVLTFDLSQGDRGQSGQPVVQDCATLGIDADDVTLRDLTVQNTFDRSGARPGQEVQALALRTRGTRIRVERCRLLGRQDTVLLDAMTWSQVRHVHLLDCLITGAVDVVYGRAVAVVEGGEIRSTGPGYLLAPSTGAENPRGILVLGTRLTADPGVAPGSVRLARPWHPGGAADAVGAATFVGCTVGPHVAAQRWADMGGFGWRDGGRFTELGPVLAEGAVPADPGPAGTRVAAPPPRTARAHLTGWDGLPAPLGALHVASDSTACDYPAGRAPRTGWGQVLAPLARRTVHNHAVSGASTASFIAAGHLGRLLDRVRPGDVVLVAFGHNDSKPDHRFTDVARTYPANLRRFVLGARARGATPVLLTPVERRAFDPDGRVTPTHGGYPQAVRDVAALDGVALVDLNRLSAALWQEQGPERSKDSFLWLPPGRWPGFPDGERDDTHLSLAGARLLAGVVADGLRGLGLLAAVPAG